MIQRCLAKQPADRFKSYDDLRRALAPYTSTAPTPATLSLRFLAGALDMLFIGLVGMVIMFLCFGNPFSWLQSAGKRPWIMFVYGFGSIAAVSLYYALFEGLWGAAAGKALCRLRVVRPDKNPPGFFRALLRALIYLSLPALPSWIAYGGNPVAIMRSPMLIQQLLGFSYYLLLALLFCTARRRNGFAAVHDLATKTRVVSRTALEWRPVLSAVETPPAAVEGKSMVGPYHVLETLATDAGGQWLLGYDLRLLRRVWIRTVPPGTPPVEARLRSIGRVGRLRWLAGRRTAEENWDAFEGVGGQPLLRLIHDRQSWRRVRFWLYDLAREIAAAEKDGTLPAVLALDRVWITGDGRAKLLDFPAPSLASEDSGHPAGDAPAGSPAPEAGRWRQFLSDVAVAALEGRPDVAVKTAKEVAVPLPLHARKVLQDLPQLADAGAVAGGLQPLLRRIASISRWRRAAVVAGCIALPLLTCLFMIFSRAMIDQSYPGLMELSMLVRLRQSNVWIGEGANGAKVFQHDNKAIRDRQLAIFIAGHYRALVTDEASWNSPIVLSMFQGDDRRFAQQSVAEHPAPTEAEIADADAALKPFTRVFEMPPPQFFFLLTLGIYVCLPALIAAVLFRGGLMLRMAGVTFVRRDGRRASRWSVLCRTVVAWSPLLLLLVGIAIPQEALKSLPLGPLSGVYLALYGGLAILSVALPERGLPDRLARTWPVPR